ncbi:hypothetical protein C0J52_13654 [Blattella germanica]|nr:hypothetical protein C0J52_13654 [Blattella germanica]
MRMVDLDLFCARLKMPKRKCGYNKDWETEFPYIKKRSEHDELVFCVKCSSKFSVAHSGRADIIQHLKSANNKEVDIAASSSSSQIT